MDPQCRDCGAVLDEQTWGKSNRAKCVYRCKPCVCKRTREWQKKNIHAAAIAARRSNARRHGVEFTLQDSDIELPELCPVLGLKINYEPGRGRSDNSPSFDRIDPSKGYIPGNVIVVCDLANRIKSNATPEQIQRVASFYKNLG